MYICMFVYLLLFKYKDYTVYSCSIYIYTLHLLFLKVHGIYQGTVKPKTSEADR